MLEGPAGIDSRHEAGATARCTAIDGRWVVRRRSRLDRAEQRETASARLAAGQPQRQITVDEEETFPPQMGLVALEPVSGFLLLEPYAADRKAATWTQALQAALVGLNVAVIQGTSDEATALLWISTGDSIRHAAAN